MKPYVGMIVTYHPAQKALVDGRRLEDSPAIVTRVLPSGLINATVFMDSGRTFAVWDLPPAEGAAGKAHWLPVKEWADG